MLIKAKIEKRDFLKIYISWVQLLLQGKKLYIVEMLKDDAVVPANYAIESFSISQDPDH